MADKKKLGDYLEVSLPNWGSTAVIRRGEGESDEQWAAVKKRVEQAGLAPVVKSGEPKPTGKQQLDMTDFQDKPEFDITLRAASPQGVAMQSAMVPAEEPVEAQPLPEMKSYVAQPGSEENPIQIPPENIKVSRSPTAGPFDHLRNPFASEPQSGPPTPAMPVEQPPQPGVLQQVGEGVARNLGLGGVVDATKSINENVIGPNRGPTDVLKQAGAELLGPGPGEQMAQLQQQSATKPQPPTPGMAAGQMPVEPTKVSQTTQVRMPGSGGGSSLEADANRAYADQLRALRERSTLEAEEAGKIAELERQKQTDLAKAEELRALRAQKLIEEQDRVMDAQKAISAKLDESLKIDPRRLWNSRTQEQRANAQLAGFLFGLGGNGLQYVQSLQAEVDRDIQNQVQEFQSRRSGLEKQLDVQQNLFAQYRQQGLDANTSATAAKENILAVYQSKLLEIAATYKDKTAGVRAAEAASAIGLQRVELVNKLKNDASVRAERASMLALRKAELEVKAAAGSKEKEEAPGVRTAVAEIDKALGALDRLFAEGAKTGEVQRFLDAEAQIVRKAAGFVGMQDAVDQLLFADMKQREDKALTVGESALKAVKGENILEADYDRMKARVPRPGLTQRNDAYIKELRAQLMEKRASLTSTRSNIPDRAPSPVLFRKD